MISPYRLLLLVASPSSFWRSLTPSACLTFILKGTMRNLFSEGPSWVRLPYPDCEVLEKRFVSSRAGNLDCSRMVPVVLATAMVD